MILKRLPLIILFLLVIPMIPRAISKSKLVDDVREKDSRRNYVIFMKDTQVGTLTSEFDGKTRFQGARAFKYRQKLDLDYTPLGHSYKTLVENDFYVNDTGLYLGNDMILTINNQTQELHLINSPDSLTGYSIQGGFRDEIKLPMEQKYFAADNFMVDQYELLLAFKDINIGDTIYDSIFVPQTKRLDAVQFSIDGMDWVRYGRLYDSAYVCRFIRPYEQTIYLTRDRKIIKMIQEAQRTEIILLESVFDRVAPKPPALTLSDIIKRLPLYLAYFLVGIIVILPFIKKHIKKPEIYIIFVLGAALYPLLKITLFPLQQWYGENVIVPGVEAGGSLYYYGLLSSLMVAAFHESFKLIPIALLNALRRPGRRSILVYGIFCGVGFGIYEACSLTGAAWQTGALKISSAPIIERFVAIVFHAITGAALGYGLYRGWKYLSGTWAVLILTHAFMLYIFVFLQKGFIDHPMLILINAFISLILLLVLFLVNKKT